MLKINLHKITMLVFLILIVPIAIVAQEAENLLTYGDVAESHIDNQNFERLYTFEGSAGDIIMITMTRPDPNDDLDPQLFLATEDNQLLISNDDTYSRDSRIIYQLPDDGTYLIVASRLSGRFGTDEGSFTITLDKLDSLELGVTSEGSIESLGIPSVDVFIVETPGEYLIQYRHIRGDYYPAMVVNKLVPNSSYPEEVARVDGQALASGTVTLSLETDAIYVISLVQSNYNYTYETERAVYTIRVMAAE